MRWSVSAADFGGFVGAFTQGHAYRLYASAADVAGNAALQPATIVFYLAGRDRESAAAADRRHLVAGQQRGARRSAHHGRHGLRQRRLVQGGGPSRRRRVRLAAGTAAWTFPLDTYTMSNGTHMITARATNSGGAAATAAVAVTVSNAPFAQWQAAHFTPYELTISTISGPDANPAGDGVSNLLKYAFYMDPKVASTLGLPIGAILNDHLVMSYTQVMAATDITYTAQAAGRITGPWSSAGVTELLPRMVYAATETVRMQDPALVSQTPLGFMRLLVTFTPVNGGSMRSLAVSPRATKPPRSALRARPRQRPSSPASAFP